MGITTSQPTQSDGPTQIGRNDPAGQQCGATPSDLWGYFGATPIAQPSGPGQKAVTRGLACGQIATIKATSLTPTTVAANTTAEYIFTAVVSTVSVWEVAANDVVFVNKPTSQAGLGIGNVRVASTNSIGLTFSNYTAGTLTPSAQSYGFVAIRGMAPLSAVLTPAAVQPNTTVEQQFNVPGLRTSLVQAIKPTAQAGIDIVGVRAVSANTLGITFTNATAATVTPTAGETYLVFEAAGLDAVNNDLLIQWLSATTVTVATSSIAEQGFTVTNIATTDMLVGVSKPTATATLGIVGFRVSTTSTIGVSFYNASATTTATPPTTDVYTFNIVRPNPAAPLVVYNQLLTPVSVAADTTAEQTFTVTGLVANSVVWVNKPSAQAGLGIAGVRVSGVNTLAITYANSSTATITPAAETYVIGNFQLPLGDAGSTWLQTASLTDQSQSILSDSIRSAQVSLGFMAGQ